MASHQENVAKVARAIQVEVDALTGPPEEGFRSKSERVVPFSIVNKTRGYIEKIANQVNGTYQMGWYDACAVLIRRLLETLIIESYEKHGLASKIKNSCGDFLYLRDLINMCLAESAWNLSRNCRQGMPRLKDIGDKSAHSRRFIAQRGDIDPLLGDIRVVVQELVYLAGLK